MLFFQRIFTPFYYSTNWKNFDKLVNQICTNKQIKFLDPFPRDIMQVGIIVTIRILVVISWQTQELLVTI